MCLTRVTKFDPPSNGIVEGWKVFRKRTEPAPEWQTQVLYSMYLTPLVPVFITRYHESEWITDKSIMCIGDPTLHDFNPYVTGFHALIEESDAKWMQEQITKDTRIVTPFHYVVRKVKLSAITAGGVQKYYSNGEGEREMTAVVGREMYIYPEKSNSRVDSSLE